MKIYQPAYQSTQTDNTGAVVDSCSFDAWGNRVGNIWNTPDATAHLFDRGYTGHEHLDQFGLINMNGRVYDPKIGRFLSPDPYIQEPENTQSFNRYSYCLNNPLIYNDPSGEMFNPLLGLMNAATTPFRWLTEATEYIDSKLNGDKDYKWNGDNYLANPHNLSNDWMNSPNVVRGPNGYPMTPDGEYSPLDFINGKRTFLDASGKSWDFQIGWLSSPKKLSDPNSPWETWIGGFGWVESGTHNETPCMNIASSQVGVSEVDGKVHNRRIIEYHSTTGKFKDDETAWCSSYVNWVMKNSGIKGTNSARAYSWKTWGVRIDKPAYGAIAIMNYSHVGFVAGINKDGRIILLGGNQGKKGFGSVNYSPNPKNKVIMYRFPSGYSPNFNLKKFNMKGRSLNRNLTR